MDSNGIRMTKEEATEWSGWFLQAGLGASESMIVPEDPPYRTVVKIGESKWLHMDSTDELEHMFYWLKKQGQYDLDKGGSLYPNSPPRPIIPPGLDAEFILELAYFRAAKPREQSENGYWLCDGCHKPHQQNRVHENLVLCEYCWRVSGHLLPLINKKRAWGNYQPLDMNLEVGDTVTHRLFGRGYILGVDPHDADAMYVLFFHVQTRETKLRWISSCLGHLTAVFSDKELDEDLLLEVSRVQREAGLESVLRGCD